jgi:hypothetical protein
MTITTVILGLELGYICDLGATSILKKTYISSRSTARVLRLSGSAAVIEGYVHSGKT